MSTHARDLLIQAIKLTELTVLELSENEKLDMSEKALSEIGVTIEDMYNLQQLRMKLEQQINKQ